MASSEFSNGPFSPFSTGVGLERHPTRCRPELGEDGDQVQSSPEAEQNAFEV